MTTPSTGVDQSVEQPRAGDREDLREIHHLRMLLDSTGEGIYSIDLEGRCTYANHAAAKLLGCRPDELIGRNMHELCHSRHADGSVFPEAACPIMQSMRDCRPVRVDADILWRLDGTALPVEYSSHPLVEQGTLRGAVVAFNDITERKRVEERLRGAEERFRALVQHASDMILVMDAAYTIQYASPAVERALGYPPDALLGADPLNVVHAEDVDTARELLRSGSPGPVELRIRHQDHSWRVLDVIVTDLRHEPGIGGIVINGWDITERKREEANAHFLAGASALLGMSLDYKLTLANVANLAVPELADWCFVDWVAADGSFERIAVAHADPTKAELARELQRHYLPLPDAPHGVSKVARTGVAELATHIGDDVLVAVARDRRHLEMLREVGMSSYMCVPLRARGRSLGTITFIASEFRLPYTPEDLRLADDLASRAALAVDNAMLYEAERAARAEAEQATRILERLQTVSDTALAHLSLDDLLRELLGRIREALAGDTATILLVTPDGQHLAAAASIGLEAEVEHEFRVRIGRGIAGRIAASREVVVVADISAEEVLSPFLREKGICSLIGAPLLVEGRLIGVLHIGWLRRKLFTADEAQLLQLVADRTALAIDHARLYREAQEDVRLRDEFLSVASHELRTPLTSMLGFAQVLLRRLRPDRQLTQRDERSLRVIVEQAERLQRLIETLLDISRIRMGSFKLEREPVDLCDLAGRLMTASEHMLNQHTLEVTCANEPVIVVGDRVRLEQMLQNLLVNAIKYSPLGGEIQVSVERRQDQAVVVVVDQGMGIPEEARAHLFQRFFRAGNVQGTNIAGFGIGLYVVHEIVSRHGGEIEVASVPGEGSTFTVRLPLDPRGDVD